MIIDDALDTLVATIEKSDVYNNYLHVLKQMKKNNDIKKITDDIRKIQKQMVKEEYINKNNVNELECILKTKKEKLYSIPLYQEYIYAAEELNSLIKIVRDKIQTYVDDLDI